METPNLAVNTSGAAAGAANGNRRSEESDEMVKVDEGVLGNRWPRQETLALLKIRSEMDVAFREAAVKAPLWEDVSRKLNEFGYNRSAKKCKEKFENIYKYHRRTKEGKSGKGNGKSYRFFDQLEALDNHPVFLSSSSPDKVHSSIGVAAVNPISYIENVMPSSMQSPGVNFVDSPSTSSTSSSGEESDGTRKKKRKLTEFFGRLMKQVIEKQENLQKKLLEAIDKCEQDRLAREEAWKIQELDRIKRERELLVQERSIAAAKDAAVLSFLQKFSDQASPVQFPDIQLPLVQLPHNNIVSSNQVATIEKVVKSQAPIEKEVKAWENNIMDDYAHMAGSSRWPKEEIEALIRLRANLDTQYQDNGSKGPLWEEISASMKKMGYNRNAKRCKEKWENMNKYFKRVKENNKKRPGDSKTCPYYHLLDALYSQKTGKVDNSVKSGNELKPEELLMHMMGQQQESVTTEDGESLNVDQNQEVDRQNNNTDGYRVVVNDPSSVAMTERLNKMV
ncbi:trihelix transcription factor DF1-like [Mercurialis annua]|uniref:trihelix transcription factor DF1-like n=1 Tax=Mercurialis annua TaxID=3986 RepID=UPI0021610A8D|nr:trihelix transcription factor DF1-like [Mercurialis annua]